MEHCDVLIVGGGPAGSALARGLSDSGLDVLILDRAPFPRDKVCAGWVTPAVLEELEIEPSAYRKSGRTLQPITGFRAGILGGKLHEIDCGTPVSYGIRRCEFDHYLLRHSGARLRLAQPVESIDRRPVGWWVNETLGARLLVGAGGHNCPVARHLAQTTKDSECLVVAQELELRLDADQARECRVRAEMPELYFTPDLKGYGWCFRKGEYLNVGLGRLDKQALRQHVHDFVKRLEQEGRMPAGLTAGLKGHAYLVQGHRTREPVYDRALLVGDALGLAYAASGEGIRPAVESGLLAASVIKASAGDYSAQRLDRYRIALADRFGERQRSSGALRGHLRAILGAQLLRSRWFVREMVIERWFLHRHQAPLTAAPRAA